MQLETWGVCPVYRIPAKTLEERQHRGRKQLDRVLSFLYGLLIVQFSTRIAYK